VYRYALPRAGYVGKRNDTEDGEPRKIGLFRKASFPIASRRERDDPEGEANPKGEAVIPSSFSSLQRSTPSPQAGSKAARRISWNYFSSVIR
jgi:hypothetical protein